MCYLIFLMRSKIAFDLSIEDPARGKVPDCPGQLVPSCFPLIFVASVTELSNEIPRSCHSEPSSRRSHGGAGSAVGLRAESSG